MRKFIVLALLATVLTVQLAGCSSASNAVTDDASQAENEQPVLWDLVPSVFVGDKYFRIHDERQDIVPEIDDTWTYLGDVLETVPSYELPESNFQANTDIVGAEIYHCAESRIPVTISTWGDAIDEEIIGESIIVVFGGQRLLYITESAHNEVMEVMENSVARSCIMVDGELYIFMGTVTGNDYPYSEEHIYLGEVTDAVSMNEYPTENLQANRDEVVGAEAYQQPSEDDLYSGVVVLIKQGVNYYYVLLHG